MKLNRITTAVSVLALLLLSACSTNTKSLGDIVTQKIAPKSRLTVTISTKYSIFLDELELAAEKKFPNLDLVLVGNYTANDSDEYAQQLKNDDLTDIILTWPLDQAARDCSDRLIDLSGMEFTSRYNLSMLNSISQNGELYYLPGPTPVRGILFNKTLFAEKGWSVPNNFDDFISLCQEIEASGMRSLQLSFWNKEVLQYAFAAFAYTEGFSTPARAEALNNYNMGKGSLSDFALPAFESFQRLVDAGIFRADDLNMRYPIRANMLYERKCAMVSDDIGLIPAARRIGNLDEFAVMPFFCPGGGSWGQLIPTQYIGLNKNLTRPENKAKYDLALQIMDFISTQDGQLALANGNQAMISSLVGSPAPNSPELSYMRDTIQGGRCVVFPSFKNIGNTLYDGLAAMLRGELTQAQVIALADAENNNPAPATKAAVIGTATEAFTRMDTGSYVTDVLRVAAGTDLALFLDNGMDGTFNARGISARFYEGDILESDVTKRVLPVLQHGEAGYLNIATMTGAGLISALEYTLEDGGWFYYASGLRMEYDPTAKPGARIKKLTDSKGNEIKPDTQYTVAIMEGSVDARYITSLQTTETLIRDIIIADIQTNGSITPRKDGRLKF